MGDDERYDAHGIDKARVATCATLVVGFFGDGGSTSGGETFIAISVMRSKGPSSSRTLFIDDPFVGNPLCPFFHVFPFP